jgi:hypothetical protein
MVLTIESAAMTMTDLEPRREPPVALYPASATAIKKAVDTLAIVPTRDKISVLTRKIYNVMLHHAQVQGSDQNTYRARLRDVIHLVDFNSNNTEIIKGYFRSMVTTRVEWQSPTKAEGTNWGVSGMIAHAELITVRGGEVMLEWSYSPKLQQALLDPQRYARISLSMMSQLRTHAALVLYEICSRYLNVGLTVRNHWTWWRPVLTGAPEGTNDTYNEWKYFKRDCLAKAVAEVNLATDLQIEPVEHRQGRAMRELQFKVRPKVQQKLPLRALPSAIDLRDIGLAIELGVPQAKAEKLYERHGSAAFKKALESLLTRVQRKDLEAVRSPEKFLAAILLAPADLAADRPPAKAQSTSKRVALLENYREHRRQEAQSLFQEKPVGEQKELLSKFELTLGSTPAVAKTYAKRGLDAPMTRSLFLKFLTDELFGPGWEQPNDSRLLEHAMA